MDTILVCSDKKGLKRFEELPETLHKDNPHFVPPFPGSVCRFFGAKSSFRRHGELFPFLAYRNGQPVGRIAAIHNRAHNDYYKDRIGFFGFFDFIDDVEIAGKLFQAASQKMTQLGMTHIRGPFNPSINEECGVLIEGHDSRPFIMMPYNPSYYRKIYEALGLTKARDLHAYYVPLDVEPPERFTKIAERVRRRSGIEFRTIELKHLDKELPVLHWLYNVTLDRNWGFVPITLEDLQATAKELKTIADPALVVIAEKNGDAVGYSLALPNINELMWRVKTSRFAFMRVLRFLWLLKTSRPREARWMAMGVAPEYRNLGIAPVFYYETLMRGRERSYIGGEISWVDETNEEVFQGLAVMGAHHYKKYRIYEKLLSP